MASLPMQENSESPLVVGRRSARLSTIIPLTIRGTDASGQAFKENTWTISINKQGAKIATFHELSLGALMTVENPVFGRTAKARVIWVGEKRFPEDPFEIGIELTEPQNVWGIKFPPQDWQKSPASGTLGASSEKAGGPPSTQAGTKPISAGALREPEAVKPAETTAKQNNARPENFNQFGVAMAGLSRFAKQAEETTEPRQQTTQPKVAEPSPQTNAETQATLQVTAKRLEEQLANLMELMRNSRAELETLLVKFQEVKRDWQSESESIQRKIQEAARPAIQSALDELNRKVRQGLDSASSGLVGDTRKRLQEELSATLEAFKKEAGSRLASLSAEYLSKLIPHFEARQSQLAEQAKQQISQLIQSGVTECQQKLRNVADETEAALRVKAEKSIEDSAAQTLGRLAQSAQEQAQNAWRGVEESFQRKLLSIDSEAQGKAEIAGTKARELCQEEVERANKDIQDRVAKRMESAVNSLQLREQEAIGKLQTALQGVEATFAAKTEDYRKQLEAVQTSALELFQRDTEVLVRGLHTELQMAVQGIQESATREAAEQLQRSADDVLESSAKQLHKQADDAQEMLGEQLKSTGKGLVEETEKRVAGMTRSTLESLAGEAQAYTEEYRAQLNKTVLEIRYKSIQDLEDHVQSVLEKQREMLRQQLKKESESASELAVAQIKSKYEQAAREASDAVYKQVGVGAVVLKDWADQASARLETSFQKSGEAFQKQIDDVAADALDKHRKESERLVEDLRARLQRAARAFDGKNTEASDPKLTQVFNDPVETDHGLNDYPQPLPGKRREKL